MIIITILLAIIAVCEIAKFVVEWKHMQTFKKMNTTVSNSCKDILIETCDVFNKLCSDMEAIAEGRCKTATYWEDVLKGKDNDE